MHKYRIRPPGQQLIQIRSASGKTVRMDCPLHSRRRMAENTHHFYLIMAGEQRQIDFAGDVAEANHRHLSAFGNFHKHISLAVCSSF
ncbi:hypothetical protein D3C73_912770 [compost metagenome]